MNSRSFVSCHYGEVSTGLLCLLPDSVGNIINKIYFDTDFDVDFVADSEFVIRDEKFRGFFIEACISELISHDPTIETIFMGDKYKQKQQELLDNIRDLQKEMVAEWGKGNKKDTEDEIGQSTKFTPKEIKEYKKFLEYTERDFMGMIKIGVMYVTGHGDFITLLY